ncbi:MAG: hypothetical protein JJT94_13980 [Bernardetiaceae bacterium]|nr:hypothetical protein [Bernardetiaceae bacterium]
MKKYKHPYQMPEGYLDKFDTQWIAKNNQGYSHKSYLKPMASIAAIAAAILIIILFLPNTETQVPTDTQSLLANLNEQTVKHYLIGEDISEDELLEYADINLQKQFKKLDFSNTTKSEIWVEEWLEQEEEWLESTY